MKAGLFVGHLDREQIFSLKGSWPRLVVRRTGDFQELLPPFDTVAALPV